MRVFPSAFWAVLLAAQAPGGTPLPKDVPREYAPLYTLLARSLEGVDRAIPQPAVERGTAPIYAAELLPANGNIGPALLEPKALEGVRAYLDALKAVGVRGVVFAASYPILRPDFPRSGEYLAFFKAVTVEARRREMVVEIESAVAFTNSPFSPLTWDYSRMSVDQLARDRRETIAMLIRETSPDYLDVGAEPDTEARITGLKALTQPEVYAGMLRTMLSGLDRGRTKLGAGLGTWASPRFVELEASLPLDFIALHIYLVTGPAMRNASEACRIARDHGKELVIDEAWLYKESPGESGSLAADTKIFARDAFAFWAPLDEAFLSMIDRYARAQGVKLVSPFWTTMFFGSLPYDETVAKMPYAELRQSLNRAAVAGIVGGRVTRVGSAYRAIAQGSK